MGSTSKIQWTEATWNPWHGCKKVSEGCKYCYMYRDKERWKKDPKEVLRSKNNFKAPLAWEGMKLIFTCSWSDFFIEEADQWRDEAWEIIKKTPWHSYQILTKRPERIKECLPDDWGVNGYMNVWIGISAENQEVYDERIPILKSIPARVRFLSLEPLIGKVTLGDLSGIDWVIVGGESGNNTGKYRFRPCKMSWILIVVSDCILAGTPVFVKQLGTHLSQQLGLLDRHGGNIEEFPDGFKIREMPVKYMPHLLGQV